MEETLHASAVAEAGRGLLILGPSGSGKSALALELIAYGAVLIADDLVRIVPEGGGLFAEAPDPQATGGPIEARGVGLLRLPFLPRAEIRLVLDLGTAETERLPPARRWRGAPLLRRPERLSPAAILLTLRSGGPADPQSDAIALLRGGPDGTNLRQGGRESAEDG